MEYPSSDPPQLVCCGTQGMYSVVWYVAGKSRLLVIGFERSCVNWNTTMI